VRNVLIIVPTNSGKLGDRSGSGNRPKSDGIFMLIFDRAL
jgi:hypothetical protein